MHVGSPTSPAKRTLLIVILVAIAVCLLLLGIWSARRPLDALILLLALLVFHSGLSRVLENVFVLDNRLVLLLSAWKEAVIAGLAVAAFVRLRRGSVRARLSPAVLAALFLALAVIRIGLDVAAHVGPTDELFAARNACEFAVLFIVVAVLAPDVAWLRRASWVLVPLVVVAAEAALIELLYGSRLYDVLYHAPGQQLASSFTVRFGGQILPRAAGTYTAPNEFGLGLAVYLFAVILPLALLRPGPFSRALLGLAAMTSSVALALTYSRSAWVGAAVGAGLLIVLLHRRIIGWVRGHARRRIGTGWRRTAVLAAAVVVLIVVFVASSGSQFLMATLTGNEVSAAARPSSLAAGVEALLHSPLGQGMTAAGPKALSVNKTAVLTENWYLVYGIQLGWLALACLCAFLGACLISLMRRVHAAFSSPEELTARAAFQIGALGALTAALVGALFIPSLLDLPASVTLWTFVAATLGPDAAVSADTAPLDPIGRAPRSNQKGTAR